MGVSGNACPVATQTSDRLLVDLAQQTITPQLATDAFVVLHRREESGKRHTAAGPPQPRVLAIPAKRKHGGGNEKRRHADVHHPSFPPRIPLLGRGESLDPRAVQRLNLGLFRFLRQDDTPGIEGDSPIFVDTKIGTVPTISSHLESIQG